MPSVNAAGRKSGLACDLSTESLPGQPSSGELYEYTSQPQTNATTPVSPTTSASPTTPFSRSTPTSPTSPDCTTAGENPVIVPSHPPQLQLRMERDRGRIPRRPKQLWSRTNHHSTIDEDGDTPPGANQGTTTAVQVALPSLGDSHVLSKGRYTSQSWSPGLRRQRSDCDPSEARDRRLSVDARFLVARGLPNGAVILSPNGDIYRQYIAPHFRRGGALVVSSSATPEFTSGLRDLVERKTSLPVRSCQETTDRDGDVAHDVLIRRRTVDVPRRAGTRTGDMRPGNRPPGSSGRDLSNTLKYLSKEELLHMWKLSEKALNRQLKEALKHTEDLQQRLRSSEKLTIT